MYLSIYIYRIYIYIYVYIYVYVLFIGEPYFKCLIVGINFIDRNVLCIFSDYNFLDPI